MDHRTHRRSRSQRGGRQRTEPAALDRGYPGSDAGGAPERKEGEGAPPHSRSGPTQRHPEPRAGGVGGCPPWPARPRAQKALAACSGRWIAALSCRSPLPWRRCSTSLMPARTIGARKGDDHPQHRRPLGRQAVEMDVGIRVAAPADSRHDLVLSLGQPARLGEALPRVPLGRLPAHAVAHVAAHLGRPRGRPPLHAIADAVEAAAQQLGVRLGSVHGRLLLARA